MKKTLYISTDCTEAGVIICQKVEENYDFKGLRNHRNISIEDGQKLVGKIGFNPVSYFEFDESFPNSSLVELAETLVKSGLFVAIKTKSGIKTYNQTGLLPEHHEELNSFGGVPKERCDELRKIYADNPPALQEIDVYQPGPEYDKHMSVFIEAAFKGDIKTANKEVQWFKKNYPDI